MVSPDVVLTLLDEATELTLRDLCAACDLHAEALVEMVEQGMLSPRGTTPASWRFPGTSLKRVRTAQRLQQDLGVNLAGAALALELLDELARLRARVRLLECQLGED